MRLGICWRQIHGNRWKVSAPAGTIVTIFYAEIRTVCTGMFETTFPKCTRTRFLKQPEALGVVATAGFHLKAM